MVTDLKKVFRVKDVVETDEELIMSILTPADGHPWGLSLVQLRQCPRHLHHVTTELYVIVEGWVKLEIDGNYLTLNQGDHLSIRPGEIHKVCDARKGTRMMVFSFPPFTMEDMIKAPEL